MNPDLARLQPYPFEKLATLREGVLPAAGLPLISLGIGEPKHPAPAFVLDALNAALPQLANYPATKGSESLRRAICDWLTQRFALPADSLNSNRHVLPVCGTREALFSFAQTVLDRTAKGRLVLSPNPFYQIYEGAAFLAGCEPYYYPTGPESDYRPDFTAIPDQVWDDCQLIYLCSPSNPTGSVIPLETLQWLINKAEKHDFLIASDECYSEIYFDEAAPPPGLLQAAAAMGNTDYKRCVVFHSLSKRSNLPGLRSGFVAGDADVLSKFLLYRTYHGCAMAPAVQVASVAAWNDEAHVRDNRDQYREKFARVLEILQAVLDIRLPDAGFYLWPQLPLSDEDFTVKLWREQHIAVLPGSYLSREIDGNNPGRNHLRMALVAEVDECVTAAERIRAALETL